MKSIDSELISFIELSVMLDYHKQIFQSIKNQKSKEV